MCNFYYVERNGVHKCRNVDPLYTVGCLLSSFSNKRGPVYFVLAFNLHDLTINFQ